MTEPSQQPVFSQIDVSGMISTSTGVEERMLEQQRHGELMGALFELITQQKRQNELIQQLINLQTAPTRQRNADLQNWRHAHSDLARGCRALLNSLSEMQIDYFTRMVEDAAEKGAEWTGSEYLFTDYIDRFGPRIMHLNGILQALSQLASPQEEL